MTDKPLKSLNGKKFTGPLATPLVSEFLPPMNTDKDQWAEYSDGHYKDLQRQRIAKMAYLALHLDIQFGHLDLKTDAGALAFYGCIAENLAVRLIPGFKERKPGIWPRELVRYVLKGVDRWKEVGRYASDLEACIAYLKMSEPDLARPGRKSSLQKRAKTLRNLVCRERQRQRAALKPVHKKPSLRIVK
jgi:hypothetical protein